MNGSFLALLFRMKYINRWSLMYNTQIENLSEHTLECAFLTHFLCSIGNVYFKKNYNGDKLAIYALFHDASEILTGDLPTPIKYYSSEMENIYKSIETSASKKLLDHLPPELKNVYAEYFFVTDEIGISNEEKKLMKIADKLCAYIKCIQELNASNKEFTSAFKSINSELESIDSQELQFFLENCLDSFSKSLDELEGNL